jgi:L,D-transpeptidase YcbB
MSNGFMHRSVWIILMTCYWLCHSAVAYAEDSPTQANMTLASKNFWQLTRALAFYQHAAEQPWPYIPAEPHLLKLGTKSQTVPLLRERLKITGDMDPDANTDSKMYDEQLANAVEQFQLRHGMTPDGVVGDATRTELNVPPYVRIQQIAINMKRWADLVDKFTDRFILVNIPDFHMYLIENNNIVLSLRAIVGKPELPTPELTSKVTRIIFNPYWNIPKKIARDDIIPKTLEDRNYLEKTHIRVFRQEDNDASEINPNYVDWQAALDNADSFHFRQDPGPENSLGLIKFEFQNSHDVYMHDTSAKELFDTHVRDLSHGCIRLENPCQLAEYLMKDDPNWNDEHIRDVIDTGKTQYVKVPHPIPIFITYITAWVDEAGRVNFRDDLYQLDEATASPAAQQQALYN